MSYGQEKLKVDGAIIIKDSEDPTPEAGTIRWTGQDFEGWNGQRWVSLTGYVQVGSVTDNDGNVYQTTRIENLEFMVENLRVTTYNDNTPIPQITDNTAWSNLTTGAWCWYNNSSSYDVPYGKLYNWYAVNTGKLCPTDWDVPSNADYLTLIDELGGNTLAGGKMKEEGFDHWNPPNAGATNESGFTALGAGGRGFDGNFGWIHNWCFFWTSTSYDTNSSYQHSLKNTQPNNYSGTDQNRMGYSVRCIKHI